MPDDETYDRSAGPDDSGVEYEYGGGTGDFERGEYNPGEDGLEDTDFEDDGVLDSSDTLEDPEDPYEDPLDTGILPTDRWSAGERFGTTLEEEREGESLDQLLAEEEPDEDPYAVADPQAEGSLPREGPDPEDEPQPRAGRLVAENEGIGPDTEPDLVAEDVGIDAGAASAEEAAVHVTDEEEDDMAGGPEG
ncbi:MAG TPA: DUF5709 domain-containing protein [Streptosporangiaceae bacterium]|nr:DUF5709 domain-containing protein [Streptosporangiaceae bacterium]